jgi:hypothetical protein
MSAVFFAAVLVGGVLTLLFVVRFPRREMTLDRANLRSFFQSLIVDGENGDSVVLDQRSSGDRILFTKRCSEGDDWILGIVVLGSNASEALLAAVESEIAGNRFWFEADMGEDGNQIGLTLAGEGISDPDALERVGRLVISLLGHLGNAKYRVTFGGGDRS